VLITLSAVEYFVLQKRAKKNSVASTAFKFSNTLTTEGRNAVKEKETFGR